MELFKQYDVEFVSCTEKFDTSTPMGRAMLNICIVFAQLERESIQMRVQDAFYSRCTKGYYMRGRTPYGFDTEPIVMDGIKTKKLVENAEMDFAELMFQMYAEPGNSYGDITRYFVKHSIKVYDKALQRAFISKLLRNPVYVQAYRLLRLFYKSQSALILLLLLSQSHPSVSGCDLGLSGDLRDAIETVYPFPKGEYAQACPSFGHFCSHRLPPPFFVCMQNKMKFKPARIEDVSS